MIKKYKIGNAVFRQESPVGTFRYQWKGSASFTELFERDLLEMGAQLATEDKPEEIDELEQCIPEHLSKGLYFRDDMIAKKINEIIQAFNTHLSACGKEKQ